MRRLVALLALWIAVGALAPAVAQAEALQKARLDQRLGAQVPPDATFFDEAGRVVTLGDYMGRRPVVLTFAYFGCSQLCTEVLDGTARCLEALPPGTDYEALTISIDPDDTYQAAAQRRRLAGAVGKRWHFLTGAKGAIRAVTAASGFGYAFDRPTHQFAHPAGLMVLTPEGRLSRYFYGFDFPASALEGALATAGREAIGRPAPEQLLRCFHDVLQSGRYGPLIDAALKFFGIATAMGLALFVGLQLRDERRARQGG